MYLRSANLVSFWPTLFSTLPDQVGDARGEETMVEVLRKVYQDLDNWLDDSAILGKMMEELEA